MGSMGTVIVSPNRYQVLNPNVIPQGFVNNREASELLLGSTNLDVNEYKIGHIKVGSSPSALPFQSRQDSAGQGSGADTGPVSQGRAFAQSESTPTHLPAQGQSSRCGWAGLWHFTPRPRLYTYHGALVQSRTLIQVGSFYSYSGAHAVLRKVLLLTEHRSV